MTGGDDRVWWTDSLEEDLRAAVDAFAPGLRATLEAEARRVLTEARARWPVATGASRDGLVAGVEVQRGGLRGFVRNQVGHAVYVKSWKNGLAGRSAMVELLRKPVAEAAPRLAARLGELFRLEVARA